MGIAEEGQSTHLVDSLRGQVLGGVSLQKREIVTQNVSKCGIYLLKFPHGKLYVGQSIDVECRWETHFAESKRTTPRSLVSRGIKKYGWQNVERSVLVFCNQVDLDEFEVRFIEGFGSLTPHGYNIAAGGKFVMQNATPYLKQLHHNGLVRAKDKISKSQQKRQALGGFEQLAKAGALGLALANQRKNSEEAKAKRKATWDRKREAKLSTMDPEKAARVRWQAVRDARRLHSEGRPPSYKESQERAKQTRSMKAKESKRQLIETYRELAGKPKNDKKRTRNV